MKHLRELLLVFSKELTINSLKKVTIIISIITTTTTAFKYTNINKQINIININTSQNSLISNMEVNKGMLFWCSEKKYIQLKTFIFSW